MRRQAAAQTPSTDLVHPSSMELMPVFRDRPSTVGHDGWIVFVSIRDAYYLAERRRWLGRIKAAHPDRQGTKEAFLAEWSHYQKWRRQERASYAVLGLRPPLENDLARTDDSAIRPTCGHCGGPLPHGCKPRTFYCSRLCSVGARRRQPRARRLRSRP
jgi:hypothetical protein